MTAERHLSLTAGGARSAHPYDLPRPPGRFGLPCSLIQLVPLVVFLALALPARATLPRPDPAVAEFGHGVKFTVSGYTGTEVLTNFPVLVRLSDNSPSGFRYSDFTRADYKDLCFVDMQTNGLPCQVDTWRETGESLVWVTLPRVTNGTEFVMWYHSSSPGSLVCDDNAWTDYAGVWHMNDTDDGAAEIVDATPNHLDAKATSGSFAQPNGRIGGARIPTKDGKNKNTECIEVLLTNNVKKAVVNNINTDADHAFTVSMWVKPVKYSTTFDGPNSAYLMGRKVKDDSKYWAVQFHYDNTKVNNKEIGSIDYSWFRVWRNEANNDNNWKPNFDDNVIPPDATSCYGNWYKLDVVYSGTNANFYVNGGGEAAAHLDNTSSIGAVPANGSNKLFLTGTSDSSTRVFRGDLDEFRLRSGAMSADWVKADFDTVDNASFLSAGRIETVAVKEMPFAGFDLLDRGAAFATFSSVITSLGDVVGGATSCEVYYKVWKSAESETNEWTLLRSGISAINVVFTNSVTGLTPGTAYSWKLSAKNNLGDETEEIGSGSFTTSGTGVAGVGGEISRLSDEYVHRFTVDGDTTSYEFTPPSYVTTLRALVVAGGGAGGYSCGGGGGAGGLIYNEALELPSGTTYTINVGTGGVTSTSVDVPGGNGGNSSIIGGSVNLVVVGGGAGGNYGGSAKNGVAGGSSGGSASGGSVANVTVSGQGNKGGTGATLDGFVDGGGGGGADTTGGAAAKSGASYGAGAGGNGFYTDVSGVYAYYAGGGGGGINDKTGNNSSGGGGDGGGGNGGSSTTAATAGQDNFGGGGGGGYFNSVGGNGGNGVVILRYAVQGDGSGVLDPAVALMDLTYDAATSDATATYRVAWAGSGYDRADVVAVWGYDPEELNNTTNLASSAIGLGSATFGLPRVNKTVYVRLVATNAGGRSGTSSEIKSLALVNPAVPAATVSASQTLGNGNKGVSLAALEANVTDIGQGATSVNGVFQICADEFFNEGTYATFAATNGPISAAGVLKGGATGLTANTVYWLRAVLTNDVLTAGEPTVFDTEPVSFLTDEPGWPWGRFVPSNDEPAFTVTTNSISAVFSFQGVGEGAVSGSAWMEVSETSDFAEIVASSAVTNVVAADIPATCRFTVEGLVPGTAYHVRCRMRNNGGREADGHASSPCSTMSPERTVVWADWNGSEVLTNDVTYVHAGEHPAHGAVSRPADENHSYEFVGWNTDRTATAGLDLSQEVVTADVAYYAIWKLHAPGGWATVNWFEEDGRNPLSPATTAEDAGVASTRADPSKEDTVQLSFAFVGWTPVDGGPTNTAAELTWFENGETYDLKAVFEPRLREYTLTFLNDDDTLIGTTNCAYGLAGGSVPAPVATKAPTAEKVYLFSGWSPQIEYVHSNATHRASYVEADNLAPIAPEGFSRGVEFLVGGYDSNRSALADFPVLVRLSEDGRNGGFSYSDLLMPGGEGLRFRLFPDGTDLDFEIDTWNPEGESLVWVQIPEMTNGTRFAMFYRTVEHHADATPVPEGDLWSDAGYVGVWHLGEPGEGEVAIHDSTTNRLDGTSAADIQATDVPSQTLYGGSAAAGRVGGARRIAYDNFHAKGIVVDATNGWRRTVVDSLTNGSFSASFWMRPDGYKETDWQWSNFITRRRGDYGESWGFGMHDKAKGMRVYYGPRTANDKESYALTALAYNPAGTGAPALTNKFEGIFLGKMWNKIDVVWKDGPLEGYDANDWPASWYVYLNGDLASCGPLPARVQYENANIGIGCSTQDDYANAFGLGDGSYGASGSASRRKGRRFNGEMDEVRLRRGAPSADWIKADHDTVASATFLSASPAMELAEHPELADVGLDEIGDDYCVITGRVLFVGSPATNSQVRLLLGTSADALSAVASGSFGYGPFSLQAAGLSPETAYWYALEEEDGLGNVFRSATTNSFTTLAAPAGNVVLTIVTNAHVRVASVTVRGEAVEPGADGAYEVPPGLPVVVAFVSDDGYAFLDSRIRRTVLSGDTTLSGADVPTAVPYAEAIRVNEIMASNGPDGLRTANGGEEMDWIELYNASEDDIDAAGWFLSDNPDKPAKDKAAIQGDCVVPPHGYKIVWMDASYTDWAPGEAWTGVAIAASGKDSVSFTHSDKATRIQTIALPPQVKDFSYGIVLGGGPRDFVYFQSPTPGAANAAEGFGPPTPEVSFSVPHGYKTEAFDLELSCTNAPPGLEIHFTTNGTSPTAESPIYGTPLRIDRTTVVRAAVPMPNAVLQYDASATYIFLDEVLAQTASSNAPPAAAALGFPDHGKVNGHAMRYGMNPDIVNGPDRGRLLRGFTNSIATLSVVIDPEHLFNPKTGIYVNPQGDGRAWERFAVLEQINPLDEADGFTVPTGLRIRGGSSRQASRAKHSFRFLFRSAYGKSELEHRMFPGDPAEAKTFDKLDLRTSQNLSWANEPENAADTFVTEVFSRDTQRDLGQPYTRSRYYHLFLNGQYWGLYQTEERADEHFGEDYLGGDSLEYDLLKTSTDYVAGRTLYSFGANEGTIEAWSNLWDIAVNEGFAGEHADNYTRVQGLYPDGARNPAYPVLLNPENLMSYVLVSHYTLDTDGPTAPFNTDDPGHLNNFYVLRNRNDNRYSSKPAVHGLINGFVFLRHDAELSLGESGNATTPDVDGSLWGTEEGKTTRISAQKAAALYKRFDHFNPAELHYRLCENPDYRRAFANYYYRNVVREDGPLAVAASVARYRGRMDEIDDAIVCEAARWGWGAKAGFTATYDVWTNACARCLSFLSNRVGHLTAQYQALDWYPDVAVPAFVDADGGLLRDGDSLEPWERVFIGGTTPGATTYYAVGGFDPCREDGTVDAGAVAYAGDADAFDLPLLGATVSARSYDPDTGVWSALERIFLDRKVHSDQQFGIRVAAVYSCTKDGGGDVGEFIVLTNLLDRAVSLEGLRIVSTKTGNAAASLDITLGPGVELAANGSLKLTQDPWWIDAPNPSKPSETAKITNGAVDMDLYDLNGKPVQTLHFDAGWFANACKGTGRWFVALEFLGHNDEGEVTAQSQWAPSPLRTVRDLILIW